MPLDQLVETQNKPNNYFRLAELHLPVLSAVIHASSGVPEAEAGCSSPFSGGDGGLLAAAARQRRGRGEGRAGSAAQSERSSAANSPAAAPQ